MAQSLVTSEFAREFEAETGTLMRRRFLWFVISAGVLYLMAQAAAFAIHGAAALASATEMVSDKALLRAAGQASIGRASLWAAGGLTVVDIGVLIWAGVHVNRRGQNQLQLARFTQFVLLYLGCSHIVMNALMHTAGFPWLICLYHVVACIFLPWTPQQALRPIGPLLLANAIANGVMLFVNAPGGKAATSDVWITVITVIMSIFAAAPGVFIAWFKHSRRMESFRVRMLQTRYGQMRRELFDAKRIHEALFPRPIHDGPLRFEYRYQPMLQIGGDYLYSRFSPSVKGRPRAFNVLLLDVTGHGIAAALTVNRLYGEVERLFAENPHTGPGEVLTALNRYVHLTLATHSVYVTALCLRFDQAAETLEYASGGHPPAFLCAINGTIEQLDSTSFVLGACAGEDFKPCVERRRFAPGDTLLAYTDGALECRNSSGRMLGVAGLTRILAGAHKPGRASTPSGLVESVLAAVESHRHGPPEDDTLIVELAWPVAYDSPTVEIDAKPEPTTIGV